MTRVAFIGLGIMGLPMAVNLMRNGVDVVGVVRPGKVHTDAERAGLTVTDGLEDAVRGADVVITMLPDTPDVRDVLTAIGPHLADGGLIIDMSTIDPVATREFRETLVAPGIGLLDAPVSGGEAGAIDGVLSIMVGGTAEDFARATALFDAMGRTVVHVGDTGAGQVVKAANQLVVAGNIQMMAEAITFLRAQDADLTAALRVIGGGLGGSTVLERKRAAFLDGDHAPGFRLSLHGKDLGIVESSAAATGLALPLTAAVTALVRSSIARGDGELDHSALLKLSTEMNGPNDSVQQPVA